jgi:hypothetical protein
MTTAVVVIPIMICRPKDVKNLLYVFAKYNVYLQYNLFLTLSSIAGYMFSNSKDTTQDPILHQI